MPLENGRWQGGVERQLKEHERRLDRHNLWLKEMDQKTDETREQTAREIAELKAKIGFGAFLGSLVGSAGVIVIAAFVTRGFG